MGFFVDIEKYSDNVAVLADNETIRYSELLQDADDIYKTVNKRTLVFLVCSNTYMSLCCYVSFLRHDVVPIMIQQSINMERFEALLCSYQPAYVFQPAGFYDGKIVWHKKGYEAIETGYEGPKMDSNLALMLTTSGSTGSPKYVKQSYKNLYSNTCSIVKYLNIIEADRTITTLPMHYTYGLSIINTHLMMGASIILTEASIMEKEFWNLLKEKRANNFGGVPYTYEMLNKLRFNRMDLRFLRYITQAGGRLGETLHAEFSKMCANKKIDFVVMYGQTEATARMSFLPSDESINKIGSIGVAIPGGKFELLDSNGQRIAEAHKIGELVYYGDNVTMGYATCADDLCTPDERNGMLETGDMAYRDEDGYYYIAGRKKRFLKVYGNRINLDELDAMLKRNGYEAVTSGEDDHVEIYTTSDDTSNIIPLLVGETGINSHAFSVINIPEIPRSESGKILYSELKQI